MYYICGMLFRKKNNESEKYERGKRYVLAIMRHHLNNLIAGIILLLLLWLAQKLGLI